MYSDGRLRIGDEIVNVNGQHLRGIQSHAAVQQMLQTFADNAVDLVIAHDELTTFPTLPASSPLTTGSSFSHGSSGPPSRQRLSFSNAALQHDDHDDGNDDDADEVDAHYAHIITKPMATQLNNGTPDNMSSAESRRSSLNRALALSPLFNSSEYIPVYANRVMITNTISDDEKWQMLSRKRIDGLPNVNTSTTERPTKLVESVYEPCRPHQNGQPLSISRSTIHLDAIGKEHHQANGAVENDDGDRDADDDAEEEDDDEEDDDDDGDDDEDDAFANSNTLYPTYRKIKVANKELPAAFPLQKSQTESCLPLATALSTNTIVDMSLHQQTTQITVAAAASAAGTSVLYVQSIPVEEIISSSSIASADSSANASNAAMHSILSSVCDKTISIHIGGGGEEVDTFVEGKQKKKARKQTQT